MQMASKEDHLLTLRRKNSASSKVSPKCHQIGIPRPQGTANSPSIESKYVGNVITMDGKVDMTSYISWWSPKRHHQQPEKNTKAHHPIFESLKQHQPIEPYQFPIIGASHGSEHSAVSALTILSQSDALTNFLQKFSGFRKN